MAVMRQWDHLMNAVSVPILFIPPFPFFGKREIGYQTIDRTKREKQILPMVEVIQPVKNLFR